MLRLLLVAVLGSVAPALGEQPAQLAQEKSTGAPVALDRSHSDEQRTTIFDPGSGETESLLEANRRAARDNLFVKYLLLSCATIGAIIAFVVWRSMPAKPKTGTESN
jgi:hypothetical protein